MKMVIIVILSLFYCFDSMSIDRKSFDVNRNEKQKFETFISGFDVYDKPFVDMGFFVQRGERDGEMYTEINKQEFSSFIPDDSGCNCEKDEFYYRPCYRIDKNGFYIIGILASCDIPATDGYPFDADMLVTYDKCGNIIDYKIVGTSGDVEGYKMKFGKDENELVVTQYFFTDAVCVAGKISGRCNVSVYKIIIDTDGTIDKGVVDEYEDNLTIDL